MEDGKHVVTRGKHGSSEEYHPFEGQLWEPSPHTKEFLDISNPKISETTLRNFSCLTMSGGIMIIYNIEAESEVSKFSPFTGAAGRRLEWTLETTGTSLGFWWQHV